MEDFKKWIEKSYTVSGSIAIDKNTMKLNELNSLTKPLGNTDRMPVLFIGHGSPMNAIEENEFVTGWRNIGKSLPKPNANTLCFCSLGN